MRKIHRWLAPIPALLLIFIAVTGIFLQVDLMLSGNPPPGSAPPAPSAAARPLDAVSPEQMHRMLDLAIQAATSSAPGTAIARMELDFAAPRPVATLVLGSATGQRLPVDLTTGQPLVGASREEDLHFVLQDLHAGYVLGSAGQWLSMACGLVLLTLGLSGLWVYVDMYRRRVKNGNGRLFW